MFVIIIWIINSVDEDIYMISKRPEFLNFKLYLNLRDHDSKNFVDVIKFNSNYYVDFHPTNFHWVSTIMYHKRMNTYFALEKYFSCTYSTFLFHNWEMKRWTQNLQLCCDSTIIKLQHKPTWLKIILNNICWRLNIWLHFWQINSFNNSIFFRF